VAALLQMLCPHTRRTAADALSGLAAALPSVSTTPLMVTSTRAHTHRELELILTHRWGLIYRRFIYKGDTSIHAQGTDPHAHAKGTDSQLQLLCPTHPPSSSYDVPRQAVALHVELHEVYSNTAIDSQTVYIQRAHAHTTRTGN